MNVMRSTLCTFMLALMAITTSVSAKTATLLDLRLDKDGEVPFLLLNDAGVYSEKGLVLKPSGKLVRLDKYYALAERKVCYKVTPSADAVLRFRSSEGDFTAEVDVPAGKIRIKTNPVMEEDASFIKGGSPMTVEISHIYNKAVVTVRQGRRSATLTAVNDGK